MSDYEDLDHGFRSRDKRILDIKLILQQIESIENHREKRRIKSELLSLAKAVNTNRSAIGLDYPRNRKLMKRLQVHKYEIIPQLVEVCRQLSISMRALKNLHENFSLFPDDVEGVRRTYRGIVKCILYLRDKESPKMNTSTTFLELEAEVDEIDRSMTQKIKEMAKAEAENSRIKDLSIKKIAGRITLEEEQELEERLERYISVTSYVRRSKKSKG